jgi:hypothetical protein
MPRQRRPSDTSGDTPWTYADHDREASDSKHPDNIIFSNVKYKGYYGFPGASIVECLKDGKMPVMLVTSYIEMTQLAEALYNTAPVAPQITLRLEIPQEVLPGRITTRVGADPTEHQERLERLSGLVRADLLQTPLLHKVYDTRVIWNVMPSEVESFGYFASQIKPLTPDALAAMIVEAKVNAIDRAKQEARDILEPRPLEYGNPVVPNSIIEVLDNVLLPEAARTLADSAVASGESPIILKAGLAAAIYLGDKGRVVSPDIDFVLTEHPNGKRLMELLMEELTSSPLIWLDGKDKAVYHCEGLKGASTSSDGTNVELDALLITRVQPHPKGFVFLCTHDEHDIFLRRTVVTPKGYRVGMIPPEQLCVEKLLAGRGPEINKFDLFDASGLLAKYQLNPHLIKKMLDLQRYDQHVDGDVAALLHNMPAELTDGDLAALGITEPGIQHIVRSLGKLVQDEHAEYPSEERFLTNSALKRFAFLSAVECSLKKVESIMNDNVFAVAGELVSIGGRFGEENVRAGIARLRAQVRLQAEYYVGMHDTFVKRALTSEGCKQRFFKNLDEQRTRLSPQ